MNNAGPEPSTISTSISRRGFLKASGAWATGSVLGLGSFSGCGKRRAPASERIRVGLIGLGGQGRSNAEYFIGSGLADIAAISDVDDTQMARAAHEIVELQGSSPLQHRDYHAILDDGSIDAVVISTPDHWHAIPTIEACQAGKDVYVEKPPSHTVEESRLMIDAARRHDRVVQVGTQQRSGEHYRRAVEIVQSGKLGKVAYARGWVTHVRDPLPDEKDTEPPASVDYDRWLGPAPERPFNQNRFHYHWRWFWDYGTGELGNWGVHHLDIILWALNRGGPEAVYTHGGNFGYQDAAETPDTQTVVYEYPGLTVTWEHRIWSRHSFADNRSGVVFNGTEASLVVTRDGWEIFPNEKDARGESSGDSEMRESHIRNFVECMKDRKRPISDIEEAAPATLLCHLGNIAYRLGRRLSWDSQTAAIMSDEEAAGLLSKRYRPPYRLVQNGSDYS